MHTQIGKIYTQGFVHKMFVDTCNVRITKINFNPETC